MNPIWLKLPLQCYQENIFCDKFLEFYAEWPQPPPDEGETSSGQLSESSPVSRSNQHSLSSCAISDDGNYDDYYDVVIIKIDKKFFFCIVVFLHGHHNTKR